MLISKNIPIQHPDLTSIQKNEDFSMHYNL